MDNIRKIEKDGEWYVSVKDVLEMLKQTGDVEKAIDILKNFDKETVSYELDKYSEVDEELSDFNKKLKQGLGWNPRESK